MTRDRMVVVQVHVELCVEGSDDIYQVEIGEDVGEDDGAFFLPDGPSIGSSKPIKYFLWIDMELWYRYSWVAVDN